MRFGCGCGVDDGLGCGVDGTILRGGASTSPMVAVANHAECSMAMLVRLLLRQWHVSSEAVGTGCCGTGGELVRAAAWRASLFRTRWG